MIRITAVSAALLLSACAGVGRMAGSAEGASGRSRVIQSADAPKAIGPYSQAIDVPGGRFVFLAGQIPLDPATGQVVSGDVVAQTERVMQNLRAVLEAAGAGFEHVVKSTIFVTDLADFKAINETYGKSFAQSPPARATVQVAALPRGVRVEIEAVAVVPGNPGKTARVVESGQAPKAIGPYSQAIEAPAGKLVFLAGQIPIDPATGQFVMGGAAEQTELVMRNLSAVLEAAGAGFEHVVKTTIFVTDLADFGTINETYGKWFKQAPPARATVQVAALPRGARVEIEAVAVVPGEGGGGSRRTVVSSDRAPKAIGPYSAGIAVTPGRIVYLAGQIPLDPKTGEMAGVDIITQTETVMRNLDAVLKAAGAGFDRVVKTTIYLTDLADFGVVNETYGKWFKEAPPARATVQVVALPRGSRVEIEAIAAP